MKSFNHSRKLPGLISIPVSALLLQYIQTPEFPLGDIPGVLPIMLLGIRIGLIQIPFKISSLMAGLEGFHLENLSPMECCFHCTIIVSLVDFLFVLVVFLTTRPGIIQPLIPPLVLLTFMKTYLSMVVLFL